MTRKNPIKFERDEVGIISSWSTMTDGADATEQEAMLAAEEPALVDDPSNATSDESDDDDDGEGGNFLYDALHGLEPLEPVAEPRQRIGTSKCGISKKSWTKEEDQILTQIVQHNGAQRWSNVAAQLPGRAGKQCRERCAALLRRHRCQTHLGRPGGAGSC